MPKTTLTLPQMATSLKSIHDLKEDFLLPTQNLLLASDESIRMLIPGGEERVFFPNEHLHTQLAAWTNMGKYYNILRESSPTMLAQNVNHWFQRNDKKRMLRTIGNQARAFLSDRYRRIDNYDLVAEIFPLLEELGYTLDDVMSCHLSDTKMYLKVRNPRISAEVCVGDIVQSGFTITNSEVGAGRTTIEPWVFRLVCLNGLTIKDMKLSRTHLGRVTQSDDKFSIYSDETLQLEDRAYIGKILDTIRAFSDRTKFDQIVNTMREAAHRPIQRPEATVTLAAAKLGLGEEEKTGVFDRLIKDRDLTQWGLVNAITRYSQDVVSYERANELEGFGGSILNLNAQAWQNLDLDLASLIA
jgi:Domain of unknown function (DUF932)